ncbi:MAG: prephenate dehydrogenase/arogenate dehydrogenase family protein [Planctomycetota bacterium]|jgi:prephenate dehydrogenase|nr:prephenate dehydrogenase/arogenate dehydrogenase family protein [Planctomycetota bacterium]
MNIYLVGLGLIGGSLAKALIASDRVCGWDTDAETRRAAAALGVEIRSPDADLADIDIALIGLYPAATVATVATVAPKLGAGKIVVDLCGVKRTVVAAAAEICAAASGHFIGGHPMAGREISGFGAARADLFVKASMLLCPPEPTADAALATVKQLFRRAGFQQIVITTPDEHDRLIAHTSQLAHLLSSSYVKSPAARRHAGFSAGSFRDLTRVAKMNTDLWTELFLANRDNLTAELDRVIAELSAYRTAVAANDAPRLRQLIDAGNAAKEGLDI